MNQNKILQEEELIANLHNPEAEERRKAAEELGILTTSDDAEVRALMDVMQNDPEGKVREMAYWALNSPANLAILRQHPDWQVRMLPPEPKIRKGPKWWAALLKKLNKP